MTLTPEKEAEMLHDAVRTIINTRDFCGDERRACIEMAMDDHGLSKAAAIILYRRANFRANRVWNHFQREAGVPEKYLF